MRSLWVFVMAILSVTVFAQDRLAEIWDHVDNRLIREVDEGFENGDFPMVVELLKVQYAYSPGDYDTFTNLGWMLENIERYDEAEQYYIDFKNQFPKSAEAAYPLGWYYFMKRRWNDCIAVLAPTINMKPAPHRNSFVALAKAYEREKRYQDAINVWQLQLKIYPDDLPAQANIDRVKAKMKAGG